jgi:hypothetical protein
MLVLTENHIIGRTIDLKSVHTNNYGILIGIENEVPNEMYVKMLYLIWNTVLRSDDYKLIMIQHGVHN